LCASGCFLLNPYILESIGFSLQCVKCNTHLEISSFFKLILGIGFDERSSFFAPFVVAVVVEAVAVASISGSCCPSNPSFRRLSIKPLGGAVIAATAADWVCGFTTCDSAERPVKGWDADAVANGGWRTAAVAGIFDGGAAVWIAAGKGIVTMV
jgi:hypothetical protein